MSTVVRGMAMLPLSKWRVTKAAVRSCGYIWSGWRHADILAKMRADGVDRLRCLHAGQGFQTTGRAFVRRDEALEIAISSGQIDYRKRPAVLLSEHLWDEHGNELPAPARREGEEQP